VFVIERTPGRLTLRYGQPQRWIALGHGDRARAIDQAKELAASLLLGRALNGDQTPVAALLLRYSRDVSARKRGQQPREDARRVALWVAWLGDKTVADLTVDLVSDFARERRAGHVTVPGLKRGLRARVSERTIGADVVLLLSVLNWATRQRLIAANPLRGMAVPETPVPRRPVASEARFQAVRAVCDQVDPSGRFGAFFDLVKALGWRLSALCQLRDEDVDRAPAEFRPHGRILRRAESDKRGVEMWVPLSAEARAAIDRLPRPVKGGWLFPSVSRRRVGKPWRREYPLALLQRCEDLAEVPRQDGGDFHPYRRKWANDRKHLPAVDVMYAGGWKDRKTLETSYQQADEATLYEVVALAPNRAQIGKSS
jgi:integrase